jgi:hypothetical protein
MTHQWHRSSMFGAGPRAPLDRDGRARYRFLLNAHRRARRITPLGELVGVALLKRLSVDGRCDPSHETIAEDVGCSSRTVRRSVCSLRALGLVGWQQRIVRAGWRVVQTSSAYVLSVAGTPPAASVRTGGQNGRETGRIDIKPLSTPSWRRLDRALERLGMALNEATP